MYINVILFSSACIYPPTHYIFTKPKMPFTRRWFNCLFVLVGFTAHQRITGNIAPKIHRKVKIRRRIRFIQKHVGIKVNCFINVNMSRLIPSFLTCRCRSCPVGDMYNKQVLQWSYSNPGKYTGEEGECFKAIK